MQRNDARAALDATSGDDPMDLWRAVTDLYCPMPRMFEQTPAGYLAVFHDGTVLHRYDGHAFASSPDDPGSAVDRISQSALNRLVEAGVAEPLSPADAPAFPESRLDALRSFLAEVDLLAPLSSGRSLSEVLSEYADVVDVPTLRGLEGPTGYHPNIPLRDGRWISVSESVD